ncbi:MAG: hypothetical protein P1V35_00810 [Planctomycetota bacterium]|nr:hypothetical protein [Planctomycetota bacterium]
MTVTRILLTILGSLALWLPACGAPESAPARESHARFKGVELYSWPGEAGQWLFSLVDGTNRLKSMHEIQGTQAPIVGLEALAAEFGQLAEGEQVYWLHHVAGFEYPPGAMRAKLVRAAQDAGIQLHMP